MNRDTKTISVDEKPYFGFKPKDYEKRNVPISDTLLTERSLTAAYGTLRNVESQRTMPTGSACSSTTTPRLN